MFLFMSGLLFAQEKEDKYIEIFYSGRAANTTRKVRNS